MTPIDNSYTAHQIDVVRYSAGEAKKVDAFLLDLIDYLETRLAKEGESIASKKRLQILLNRTREDYATRADMHADINRVLTRIDNLDQKIDRILQGMNK